MGPIVGRAVLACVLLLPCAASAIDEIATEEYVADLMATPRPAEPKSVETRSWAVLPEVGFGPDTGPLVGGKFTDRDVAGSGVTLDAEATQALERQQMLSLTAGTPHLVTTGSSRFSKRGSSSTPSANSSASETTTSAPIPSRSTNFSGRRRSSRSAGGHARTSPSMRVGASDT